MTLPSVQDNSFIVDRESLLRRITYKIRRSLNLQEILNVTVAELSSFLKTHRIKIYKFHPDGSGQVVAEYIREQGLPSLYGLSFPADDIPLSARELFIKAQVRVVVDVDSCQLGQSILRDPETGEFVYEDLRFRPVDPCHAEYLTAMGVKTSLVLPILHQDQLWGLLVSHHAESHMFSEYELTVVQIVTDQLCVAIAQSILLAEAQEKVQREAVINRVAMLLHSQSAIELQTALEETVAAFEGSGGRLCFRSEALELEKNSAKTFAESLATKSDAIRIYTCGEQPLTHKVTKYQMLEEYHIWHEYFKSHNERFWAISDLHLISSLRNLQPLFESTKIRSLLMVPLSYRQQEVGYLSIFRNEFETDILWAGQFDPDERQLYPRQSFAVWRQSDRLQVQQWKTVEIELAQTLATHFATAIQQYEMCHSLERLNGNLEQQVQERTAKLQQAAAELSQTLHELKATQTQLIQREKMASLGQLVAGIAHEINNPVNFIYGNFIHIEEYVYDLLKLLELYQNQFPNSDVKIRELAEDIDLDFIAQDLPKTLSSMKIGTDRIRKIVLSLRNFSRLDQADIKLVDIHEGIDSTLLILQYRLKGKSNRYPIEVIKEYDNLPLVECYAGQLNQVFMNILVNAIDALEDKYSDWDTMQEKNSPPSIPQIRISTQFLKNYVKISIADNGPGISESIKNRLFDPFFTTKTVGKGTGLGLSISYHIVVEKHQGKLECHSSPTQGTEFVILIPQRQT
ncbi:GAF domain-containing protein [Scytonema sp. UIC 10036]|uniref:GAF domain-containing sensor histidine kinase n=1 Tax=Scytonema sp. UIC 10036 TaxID=2304196 RepID=UPI0012DAB29F|nr:ATP-binding protein [Scytonema sp. UIC 10036]MUG98499.1 GAF domain-containing protein [Scytonema sp. UIC 10036]